MPRAAIGAFRGGPASGWKGRLGGPPPGSHPEILIPFGWGRAPGISPLWVPLDRSRSDMGAFADQRDVGTPIRRA